MTLADRLNQVRQLRTHNDLDKAIATLIVIDDEVASSDASIDLSLDLAVAARDAVAAGKVDQADLLCERTLVALRRSAAEKLPQPTRAVICLTIASAFHELRKPVSAAKALSQVLERSESVPQNQKGNAIELGLKIGWNCLASEAPESAEQVYGALVKWGDPNGSASLGHAWAVAIQERRGDEGAELLLRFVEAFPDHSDAPRALAMRVECLSHSEDSKASDEAFVELLNCYPNSQVAVDSISALDPSDAADSDRLESAWSWLSERLKETEQHGSSAAPKLLSPRIISLGLWIHAESNVASIRNDLATWDSAVARLNQVDSSGQAISDLLNHLDQLGHGDAAEQIAAKLIDQASFPESDRNPRAEEAACRWAGRTQRWTMLALAAGEASSDLQQQTSRSIAAERLYAEALMQTGKSELADQWWRHLVDRRGAADFATLLRCAETVGMYGTIQEAAERIAAARKAAEKGSAQIALVDFLESELAIRRLDFDSARSFLEQIVRGADSPQSLRGRAQWMIGETHFLQHQFARAINEYRKVEGIDPGGEWISTSLVQAGKSFEQLGRTREAAICYSDLITRFPRSRHAMVGRNRLAAIVPDSTGNQRAEDASKQSIQR